MWQVGESGTIRAKFYRNGTLTDPGTITLYIKKPGDSSYTAHAYGTDPDVVKESVGVYSYLVVCDTSGNWLAYWEGTAPVPDIGRCDFPVKPA